MLYEEPDDLADNFGRLSMAGPSTRPPRSSHGGSRSSQGGSRSSQGGMFRSPKADEWSMRAGELAEDLDVHPDPASRVEYLPDRPGALLFGEDQTPRADIDRRLRLPDGTYHLSLEGIGGFGVLHGRAVTPAQAKDIILNDPRSHDLDIALVQCDPALPGVDALDSFLTDLWRELVADGRWNPQRAVIGAVGGAKVQAPAAGESDVLAMGSTIAPDGSIRLNTGGFRSITKAPGTPAGEVIPRLRQHGVSLRQAMDEVRSGGGIPLTDALGNLLDLPRAAFLGKGLNDPVHVQGAVEHQGSAIEPLAPVAERTGTAEPTWEVWRPGNVTEVRPNVFVASSHPIPATAEANAYYDGLAAGATDVNPIVDVGVNGFGANQKVAPQDVASARLMLEQFAQRNRQAFLSTRGRDTNELLNAAVPYGAPLIHQTLAKGDQGGLSLGPRFTFTLPRTAGRAQLPSVITEGITAGLLDRAKEMATPTSAIKPVSNDLAAMIWAADLAGSKERFREAGWSAEQMTQHLGEVSAMSERVGNLPKVAIIKPVLEFGAVGHADLVFDYGMTDNAKRGGQLMDSLGEMRAAGKLGTDAPDALTVGHFSSMVAAAGTVDLSLPTLSAIDAALAAGDLDAALTSFNQYKGQFTRVEKMNLVDGLDRLKARMPEQVNEIQRTMQSVLDC